MGLKARHGLLMFMSGGAGDTTPPTVVITSTESSPTYAVPIPITITFSEAVRNFAVSDIRISGGSLAGFTTADNTVFTVNWTTANGANTMDIDAGVCLDYAGNLNEAASQFSITSVLFTLKDDFTDARAGGAVNGTPATPTGGNRVVVDGNSKLSISAGVASFETGGVTTGNPGLWYSSTARAAGKTLILTASWSAGGAYYGFDTNQTADAQAGSCFDVTGNIYVRQWPGITSAANVAGGTMYTLAIVLRATGMFGFIKGGTYSKWTFMYPTNQGNVATLYPAVIASGTAFVGTCGFIRMPESLLSIAPVASDAFTRADGLLGNTGGGGSEESGGTGKAWTAQSGTWGVASNVAACSALTGSAIATVNSGKTGILVECVCTRTGGNTGLVVRYADANNYLVAYHDGTNVHLDKVVGGTPTSQISVAATYSATARLAVVADGTTFRLYYNDTWKGSELTITDASLQTGTACGLYTTDTGATFNDFVVWARGGGDEYVALDGFINP